MSEQDLVNMILDWFHIHGAWAERINSGTQVIEDKTGKRRVFRGAKKGTSDILACWPGGLFMAVEAKLPGNKPTPAQELFLAQIRDIGGLSVVAYSIDDVENAIKERIRQCQT
jgi:hypothetical protein